jgi:TolA-binding protein
LSVIFASGIATALYTGAIAWPFRSLTSSPSEQVPARSVVPKPKPKRERQQPSHAQPAPSEEQVAPALPAAAPEKLARKPSVSVADGAAGLFHDANAARRDGDLRRARRLYAQLIAMHPGSDEAGLARVSLGSLLLAAGDARGAEREFRAYLAGGGGQLREEALVGQAQSLGKLGRTDEERAAWKRLLDAHPSSVYAAQARLRLDALEGAHAEGAR